MRAPDFILASASPRRKELLSQIGLVPTDIVPANIDESALSSERPDVYAMRMALEKAQAVAALYPNKMILAADTVVAVGRRILPKAETETDARGCLKLLQGRQHRVYGGICLISTEGRAHQRLSESQVRFRRLAVDELAAYIEFGDWNGKAGGYAIQGLAARYIQRITGSYSNIVGLDLYQIAGLFRAAGQ